MAWTEDRVEKLAKLWEEGLSASQIAKELGGVTRNAVIGKVHRLGLSGRAKPAANKTTKPRRKPSAPRSGASFGRSSTARPTVKPAQTNGKSAGVDVMERPVKDAVAPVSKKLCLMELTESTCRWPYGDPTRPGFSFCGHQTQEEKPYCEYHSQVAFQPMSDRRRRR